MHAQVYSLVNQCLYLVLKLMLNVQFDRVDCRNMAFTSSGLTFGFFLSGTKSSSSSHKGWFFFPCILGPPQVGRFSFS